MTVFKLGDRVAYTYLTCDEKEEIVEMTLTGEIIGFPAKGTCSVLYQNGRVSETNKGHLKLIEKTQENSKPTSQKSTIRRFVLERNEDVSGTSGTGRVAEGVVFSNGQVAYSWISPLTTVTICQSVDVLEKVHGHEGRTRVKFLD